MITSRHKPQISNQWANFHIWKPKYSTDSVLLRVKKINKHNKIRFTEDKNMNTDYYVSKDIAQTCPINMVKAKGKDYRVEMYEIPLNKLDRLDYYEEIFK